MLQLQLNVKLAVQQLHVIIIPFLFLKNGTYYLESLKVGTWYMTTTFSIKCRFRTYAELPPELFISPPRSHTFYLMALVTASSLFNTNISTDDILCEFRRYDVKNQVLE